MKKLPFSYLILSAVISASVALFSSPTTSIAAPAKKVAIKKAQVEETQEAIQKKFEQFALKQLESFNRTTLYSEKRKKVEKNPDGTYTASYTHFDKESIKCSFKPAENATSDVKYIGNFSYLQQEFKATGATEKAALAGPFKKNMQTPVSELVKYKKGNWSY